MKWCMLVGLESLILILEGSNILALKSTTGSDNVLIWSYGEIRLLV